MKRLYARFWAWWRTWVCPPWTEEFAHQAVADVRDIRAYHASLVEQGYRPVPGACPGCRVAETERCRPGCSLIDQVDHR